MNKELGKLKKLDPRDYWKHEARDLTVWLSQSANLNLLAKALGLGDLDLVGTEQYVGEFKADIVARADESDDVVIIENQLERTNHDHLGKLLTYASGLTAQYIVWISPDFREDHRRALTWLNDVTDRSISFFGIKLELLQIDDSPLAPQFTLVSQPNEWAKRVKASAEKGEFTELELRCFEFWSEFVEFCKSQKTFLSLPKPRYRYWFAIGIGKSGYHIGLTVISREQEIGCDLYIRHSRSKTAFDALMAVRTAIESQLGPLEWKRLEGKQACKIAQYRSGNIEVRSSWPDLFAWLKERAESFHRVFSPLVGKLDLPERDDDSDRE
jgi:Domain of unknown function (DUF4268)